MSGFYLKNGQKHTKNGQSLMFYLLYGWTFKNMCIFVQLNCFFKKSKQKDNSLSEQN